MGTPVSFSARRLIFFIAAAFTILCGSVASSWGQPTLISQPIPALNLTTGAAAQTVNLTNYIQNPNASGTVVRIAVGTLSPSATTIAPSSMVLMGNIDIALTDSLTPKTVANFLAYINSGAFVDNIIHRLAPNFVIQGGGFNFSVVNGSAQAGLVPTFAPVPFEQGLSNVAGTIAMAQSGGDQNSATSQWFINLEDNSSNLDSQDGGFCAFGTVLGNGMAVANAVAALSPTNLTNFATSLSSNANVQANIAGAWASVPLTNVGTNLSLSNFIFTNISKIPALTFTATSGNTGLVTANVTGNTLTLTPVVNATGSTTITVTAADTEGATFQTTFTVKILAKATVTLSNLTQTYTGAARAVTVATNPAGLAFNLTYNGSATAPTLPGSYAVVATVTDANHVGLATGTLVINKSTATVTLSNLSQLYNGSAKTVTVTTNPVGLAVSVTYNGSTTAPVNGGSYAVVATVTDPNSAGSSTGTLTITKAAQTITFGALTVQKVGNAAFVLTATASSGLTVSYTSSNAAVATVSGNTVTIVGKGTATITALQAGNANYNAATNVAQTLTVNQTPFFTTQPANKTVTAGIATTFTIAAGGTPAPTLQWQRQAAGTSTFVNLANGGSYSGATTSTLSVGNTTVAMAGDQFQCVATNVAGSATSNPATLTVNKAPATVTLSNLTQTYTGTARAVTVATSPAGLAFNLTYNGSTTAPTVPGSYAVVATVTDANHTGSASGTLVINKSTATVTLSNLSQLYNGSAKTVTVTTNPVGLAVSVTYNGSTTAPVNGGSYAVVANVTDPNSAGTGAGTFTITKAAQTITFGALTVQKVGNAAFALTATASSGLLVSYASSNTAVATISGNTVTIVGKGTATITALQAGNSNYNAATNVAQTLTVNQTPFFTTQPANKTATAGQTATFTVVAGGLPAPNFQWQREAAGTSTFVNLANGGSYSGVTTATLSVGNTTVAMAGDQFQCVATNVAGSATSNPATLTVNKAPATVTLSNLTQTYTGAARAVTVATNPAGLTFNLTYNGSTTAPVSAGNYTVVATITDANHSGATSGNLVINKATATVTVSNLSQTYDGTAKSATVTTNPVGLSVNVTYNGSTTLPVNAGSYPVVVTVVDANYAGTAKGTLAIGKAAQIISFGTLATETVGNNPFSLGATASSGLAVTYSSSNTAVATVSNGLVTIVGKVGTAAITASQSGNANYNAAANVGQTLTVVAASTGGSRTFNGGGAVGTIAPIAPSPPTPIVAPPIVWSIVNNADSAAWVSGIDSSSTADEPSPTAADLPALLLKAMNLNITSPSNLLPSAGDNSTLGDEPISQDLFLTLQYRQSKDLGNLSLVTQYSTDDVNWIAVPAGDLTQLPDDDENTERWSARIAVPAVGPIFLRLEVSQNQ